jgi:hypothetical protein
MYWLAQGQNAAAVQALSAVVTAVLTIVLVWATLRYVKAAHWTLAVARDQLKASTQPQPLIEIQFTERPLGTMKGTVRIENVGTSLFRLYEGWIEFYAGTGAGHRGANSFQLEKLMGQVVLVGESTSIDFDIEMRLKDPPRPNKSKPPVWTCALSLTVQDVFGVKHAFNHDGRIGFSYFGIQRGYPGVVWYEQPYSRPRSIALARFRNWWFDLKVEFLPKYSAFRQSKESGKRA